MSKAFVRQDADSDDDIEAAAPRSPAGKNYITPAGFARLKSELKHLAEVERPAVVKTVAWAASLGDRSENADYLYGKKRLREIDRRVRFLIKRLEQVRVKGAGGERTVRIVGTDEVDPQRGDVSWISPIARALLKARQGDSVVLRTPVGEEKLEILEVSYP